MMPMNALIEQNVVVPQIRLLQDLQLFDRHRLTPQRGGKFNNGPAEKAKAMLAEERQDSFAPETQHGVEEGDVSIRQLGRGNRQDLADAPPEDDVWKWIAATRLAKVAQRDRTESGTQRSHAIKVCLIADEGAIWLVAPPTQRTLALVCLLVSVEAPEGWAYHAVFSPEDVGHMNALEDEGLI